MRIPVMPRRLSAWWATACMAGVALSACAGSAQAGPDLAPGFCAAPAASAVGAEERPGAGAAVPWGAVSIATVSRSVQRAVFVDCQELGEWRRGERSRFSHYGVVTLYRGAELVARAFPSLTDGVPARPSWRTGGVETGDIARAATEGDGLVQERVANGVLYRTRLLEKGAALPAEPAAAVEGGDAVARAEALTLHLSGASLSAEGDVAIERSIVMPYRNDDTLRYLQAALLAGVSADRISLLSLP